LKDRRNRKLKKNHSFLAFFPFLRFWLSIFHVNLVLSASDKYTSLKTKVVLTAIPKKFTAKNIMKKLERELKIVHSIKIETNPN